MNSVVSHNLHSDATAAARAALSVFSANDDAAIDLGESALMLSVLDDPATPVDPCRAQLSDLALAVAMKAGDANSAEARLEALIHIIHEKEGYRGDGLVFETPENACLARTMDRRKGPPVPLGILYLQTARAQGWAAFALAFPDHFLIALETGTGRVIFDPFYGDRIDGAAGLRAILKGIRGNGAELVPQHYGTLQNRSILLRMQNDIKEHRAARGQYIEAARALEHALIIAPDEARLFRDIGLCQFEAGNFEAALAALDTYLDQITDPENRREAVALAEKIRARMN